ncbi:unnamed protein product [Rhizoctonia solani]|uniref:Protein kinase domain-containing protein n=1 Tax=Rhizoctonia solani TaxID=456999 RepID=A0A8H3AFJ7_9AGAM|nr:unnamed protein product [Rhizoctonia solani]
MSKVALSCLDSHCRNRHVYTIPLHREKTSIPLDIKGGGIVKIPPLASNLMSNSPTQNPAAIATIGDIQSASTHRVTHTISNNVSTGALTGESPPIAGPQLVPADRPTLQLSESAESRMSKMRFPLRPFRSSSRGTADPQSYPPHPVRESSISLPIEVGKKRRWPQIRSLAALLGLRGKGRAGKSLDILKEHDLNGNNASVSASDSRLFSEIPEVESQGIDEESRPAIAQPAPANSLQPYASLTPPPPPQEPLDPGTSVVTSALQGESSAPGASGQAADSEIPHLVVNDSHPPMSRKMPAQEVVSRLVVSGCEDLSERVDASTFGHHPFAIGGLSDIYYGCLTDHRVVAVKALRIAAQHSMGDSPGHLLRAARELHTWSKCKHPNVLPLYGLATFRDRIGMVSPWMSKGTLPQYLKTNPNADRRDMCVQICEGLTYIHAAGIIHGDLKGANVLVDDNDNAVLADFGSSTLKDQSLKFTQAASGKALTIRWSAPELVTVNNCQHTKASDVFALGMTIYEVLTGKVPYHEIKDVAPVILQIINRDIPTRPVSIPVGHASGDALWHLFTLCWKYEPEERPSAAEVAEMV